MGAGRRLHHRSFWRRVWDQRALVLMALPAFIIVLIFSYIPMYGISIAFQKFKPLKGMFNLDVQWVGLKYFRKFFQSPYIFRLLRNNLLLGVYSLLWGFPLPIIFAVLLDQLHARRFKKIVQTISYLPHFLSVVVLVGMIKMLFASNGIVNDVIRWTGGEPVYFLISPRWYRTLYIGSGIWQGLGWSSIIYLAALTNVDPQLMEAAVVDGANRFQRVWNVSLPALMPTISIQLIFSISGIMSASTEKTLLLYNEATYEVGDVIGTYVYREGILGGAFEYTTAIGLLMSIVSLVLITLANYGSRLFSENSLW